MSIFTSRVIERPNFIRRAFHSNKALAVAGDGCLARVANMTGGEALERMRSARRQQDGIIPKIESSLCAGIGMTSAISCGYQISNNNIGFALSWFLGGFIGLVSSSLYPYAEKNITRRISMIDSCLFILGMTAGNLLGKAIANGDDNGLKFAGGLIAVTGAATIMSTMYKFLGSFSDLEPKSKA